MPPRADAAPAAPILLPAPFAREENRRTADDSDTTDVRRRSATIEGCCVERLRSFRRYRRDQAPRRTFPTRTLREPRIATESRVGAADGSQELPEPDIRRPQGRRDATGAIR